MELNMMMRDQAKQGLQTQLDAAVTDGDTVKAREISDKIAALEVATAPKANAYGDAEIRAELNKLNWFGVDPVKSEIAVALGKSMDPKKFATAAASSWVCKRCARCEPRRCGRFWQPNRWTRRYRAKQRRTMN